MENNKAKKKYQVRPDGLMYSVTTCPAGSYIQSLKHQKMMKEENLFTNECGAHVWNSSGLTHLINATVVPNEIKPCCNAHDACFQSGYDQPELASFEQYRKQYKKTNIIDSNRCNLIFQGCMNKHVNQTPWWNLPKKAYMAFISGMFSMAVIKGGHPPNDNNLTLYHECERNNENGVCYFES